MLALRDSCNALSAIPFQEFRPRRTPPLAITCHCSAVPAGELAGDFDRDGNVDFDDYTLIDNAYWF